MAAICLSRRTPHTPPKIPSRPAQYRFFKDRYVSDDDLKRFWSRVDVRGEDDCWPWIGPRCNVPNFDYGIFYLPVPGPKKHVAIMANRLVLQFKRKRNLGKTQSLHTCDNPPCCNPKHLFPGNNSINQRDCVAKGRHASTKKTHCKRGHPLDDAYIGGQRGERICRQCAKIKNQKAHAKRQGYSVAG